MNCRCVTSEASLWVCHTAYVALDEQVASKTQSPSTDGCEKRATDTSRTTHCRRGSQTCLTPAVIPSRSGYWTVSTSDISDRMRCVVARPYSSAMQEGRGIWQSGVRATPKQKIGGLHSIAVCGRYRGMSYTLSSSVSQFKGSPSTPSVSRIVEGGCLNTCLYCNSRIWHPHSTPAVVGMGCKTTRWWHWCQSERLRVLRSVPARFQPHLLLKHRWAILLLECPMGVTPSWLRDGVNVVNHNPGRLMGTSGECRAPGVVSGTSDGRGQPQPPTWESASLG